LQALFYFFLEPVLLSVLFMRLEYTLNGRCALWTVGLDPTNKEAEIVPHYLRGTALSVELVEIGLCGAVFDCHAVSIR